MANYVDPGSLLYARDRDDLIVVLHDHSTSTCVQHVLCFVYDLYRRLGSDDDEQETFLRRLCEERAYFDDWCRDLPLWAPDKASFREIVSSE